MIQFLKSVRFPRQCRPVQRRAAADVLPCHIYSLHWIAKHPELGASGVDRHDDRVPLTRRILMLVADDYRVPARESFRYERITLQERRSLYCEQIVSILVSSCPRGRVSRQAEPIPVGRCNLNHEAVDGTDFDTRRQPARALIED